MENPAIAQQFKALLLCAAGLVVAIFIGWNIGAANYWLLILGAVVFGGVFIAFFSGRFFWVLTIASSFLTGAVPILGGQFTPFEILMAVGVAKFLVEDIVLRRARLKLGNRFDLFLIAGFMGIITFHALRDRFGMRFLGSEVWGGHNYVNVYVGLAAFFVIQSIPMKPKVWAKFPYVVVAVTAFDLTIALLTTISPALIFKIYPFYSAVSVTGIEEILTGSVVETARNVAFGGFGVALIALVLASISLRQILSPTNLLRIFCLLVGSLAVLFSSYRSPVVNTLAVVLVASVRDFKFKVFLLLPILALFLFGLSVLNSEFVHLPKQMQRSLTFIPGKWDADMARSAEGSNEFRRETWDLWMHDYFPAHPWVGRGFGFRREWAKPAAYNPKATDYRQTVEVQNIHNGLFAALDTFGIVGTIFFVIWNLRLLTRAFRVPFIKNDPAGIVLRFLALWLGGSIIFYWAGAFSVGSFLPQEFALAGVFLRLRDARASDFIRNESADVKMPHSRREELMPA